MQRAYDTSLQTAASLRRDYEARSLQNQTRVESDQAQANREVTTALQSVKEQFAALDSQTRSELNALSFRLDERAESCEDMRLRLQELADCVARQSNAISEMSGEVANSFEATALSFSDYRSPPRK